MLGTSIENRQKRDDQGRPISMTWPDVSVETVTRVILIQPFIYKIDEVMEKLHQFTNLVYLELVQVDDLEELDLRGLSSLRAIKVKKCKDLKANCCNCAFRCAENDSVTQMSQFSFRCLKDLRSVQLIDLPNLKIVSFALHASNLESLLIYDCLKVVEALYQFHREKLKRLVSPRVGISPSDSALKDVKDLVLDVRKGQFSKEYLINDARRILLKSVYTRTSGLFREVAPSIASIFEPNPKEWAEIVAESNLIAEIARANSIYVGWHIYLTTVDLTGSKIKEVVGLSELRNLEALCLYGCTELLRFPDIWSFTKLKRLCISHCHKLAKTLPRDIVPENVEDFHSLGDKCNFGEHECLDCLDIGEGNCEECKKNVCFMERGENSGEYPTPWSIST